MRSLKRLELLVDSTLRRVQSRRRRFREIVSIVIEHLFMMLERLILYFLMPRVS